MKIHRFGLFLAFFLFFSRVQAEDIIQMLPLRTTAGITTSDARSIDFVLNTTSNDPVWGYQLDILLPIGVQFDESLNPPFTLQAERYPVSPNAHHIDCAHLPTGWWRIIVTPDDASHLTGKTGIILRARFTTSNDLTDGLHPILVKRSVIALNGTEGIEPMQSTSYAIVGDAISTGLEHVDFSEAKGLLPSFVVDSLNQELSTNEKITRLDIRQVDQLGKSLHSLPNTNALVVAKAGTAHATRTNTLAWAQSVTPICDDLYLDEEAGTFEMPFDFHANTMEVVRTVYRSKWNTLCLPFALSKEQIYDLFGDGTQIGCYKGIRHGVSDTLVFERMDTALYALEANTPYLIKAGTDTYSLMLDNFDLEYTSSLEQNIDDFVFMGTYQGKKVIPMGCYFISDNQFWLNQGASLQRPFRAYFRDDTGGAGVKQLSFSFWQPSDDDGFDEDEDDEDKDDDEIMTKIDGTHAIISDSKPIYNLQGQRVLHPRRGIYIREGRKLFIP